jgi:arsenate reductase
MLETMEVWINPSCAKCRAAKADLDAAGVEYIERRYLETPPTEEEFSQVLGKLNKEPWEVARAKETAEAGINFPKDGEHRAAWISAMVSNPGTIQRPIIINQGGMCAIARDPDTVKAAINDSKVL